jgi:hypothetical protein
VSLAAIAKLCQRLDGRLVSLEIEARDKRADRSSTTGAGDCANADVTRSMAKATAANVPTLIVLTNSTGRPCAISLGLSLFRSKRDERA